MLKQGPHRDGGGGELQRGGWWFMTLGTNAPLLREATATAESQGAGAARRFPGWHTLGGALTPCTSSAATHSPSP